MHMASNAALAAGGGLLTGGLGSGAVLSKAAKEARALEKAAALEDVRKISERMAKNSREARDFFEGITPTKITRPGGPTVKGSEYQSRAARDAKAYADSMRAPPQIDPSFITEQSTRSVIPPELAIGVGGAAAIGALGSHPTPDMCHADLA